MNAEVTATRVSCPYCGETLTVFVDPGDVGENYIEDCQVCCRPITFVITASPGGDFLVAVHSEDEAF